MNKTLLPLSLLLISSCNCDDNSLKKTTGLPCIENSTSSGFIVLDAKELHLHQVGECMYGITELDDAGEEICVGQIFPKQEECNLLDDDCDTVTDNDLHFLPPDSENTCNDDVAGVCIGTTQMCINGEVACILPDQFGPEACDSFYLDENCNGLINEDDPDLVLSGEQFSYSGPPETLNIGECRAGLRVCRDGAEIIVGERGPVTEICGNGDDDDCDGLTDELETTLSSTDFLIILDFSGSMYFAINATLSALCDWSVSNVLSSSRFAIIGIGANFADSDQISLVTDFTDATGACIALNSFYSSTGPGSLELQLDAVLLANMPGEYSVSWNEQHLKRIMIFSDEVLQTAMFSNSGEGVQVIIEACENEKYAVGGFTLPTVQDIRLWQVMTSSCSGFLEELDDDEDVMIERLNYWFGSDCGQPSRL